MSEDSFPYKRYSLPDSPLTYFKRAQKYTSTVEEKIVRTLADESRLLKADSVVSRTSRAAFLSHFPLHYLSPAKQPRRAVIIRNPRGSYENINVLPDYYTEDARVRDVGAYEKISPFEFWNKNRELIEEKVKGPHAQRELLWTMGPKEARQGKITNYLTLFALLKSKIVLDPSAAWGDRLIAALASRTVEAYTGVDPHSRLPRGWTEILEELGSHSGKNGERFVMINEPFEISSGTPLPEGMGTYDTCLMSGPPLFGDQYDRENPQQAVAAHGASFGEYVTGFLIPYLSRAIAALKVEGYLCITVLDRARDNYFITELQLLLVELIMGSVMEYKGVVFWSGDNGGLVPWWIFRKRATPISVARLEDAKRLFKPYVQEIKNYFGH